MSDVFKPGRHPDADQLSAFVERALPAHEREATLAHLAVCAECRAVIALSLPAEQIAVPAEKPARRAWFHGWNLAWPAAAAVAALALVIAFVHHVSLTRSSPGRNAEIALAPKPAPISPQPLPEKQPSAPAARNLRQAPAKKSAGAGFGNAGALDELLQAPAGAPSATRMQSAAGGGGGGGNSIINKDLLKQSSTMADGRSGNLPLPAAKEQPGALAPTAIARNQLAADALRQEIKGTSGAPGSAISANETANRAALKAAPAVHSLPSGLPLLSSAGHGRQMLALDTAHTLFLSEDAGGHWRAVAVPWKVRAVAVSLVSLTKPTTAQTGNGFGAGLGAGLGGGIGSGAAMGAGKLRAAEGPASITGTVTDATGAAVSGASIIVSSAGDHASHTVVSDGNGRYTVAGLTPGTYSVEVHALGFQIARVSAVTVSPPRETVENFKLSVGSASQTVTVAAGSYAEKIPLQSQAQANVQAAIPTPPRPATASVAATPPPVFQITTEDGSRWTSADGVTWKHQ